MRSSGCGSESQPPIAMTIGIFLVIQFSAYTVTGLGAEAVAGVASLIAVAIATTMVLWMKKAAAGISGELRTGMADALETGAAAVLLLAFLAVGREGFETALFMVGYAEAETLWPLTGLVIGVLVAVAIVCAMYAGAVRVDLSKFFKYTGVFLIVVAAGILVLRRRCVTGRRMAAGFGYAGIRHFILVRLVVLVRRDHPRRVQCQADSHRAASRRVAGVPDRRAYVSFCRPWASRSGQRVVLRRSVRRWHRLDPPMQSR